MGFLDRLLGRGSSNSEQDPEVQAVFRKINRLMTDDTAQNTMCHPEMQQAMARGGAVDQLPGATGEFGRSARNPIPVNGPIGEMVYLSNLVAATGSHVIGHRLGSVDRVDVYEIVALDGSRWDLLYLDFYHIRKSQLVPSGYRAAPTEPAFFLATNRRVTSFPAGFYEAMQDDTEEILGMSLVSPDLRDKEALFRGFRRPRDHAEALRALQLTSSTRRD